MENAKALIRKQSLVRVSEHSIDLSKIDDSSVEDPFTNSDEDVDEIIDKEKKE